MIISIIFAVIVVIALGGFALSGHQDRATAKIQRTKLDPFTGQSVHHAVSDLIYAMGVLDKSVNMLEQKKYGAYSGVNELEEIKRAAAVRTIWLYVERATSLEFADLGEALAWENTLRPKEQEKVREVVKLLMETDIETSGSGFSTIEARLDSIIEINRQSAQALSVPRSTLQQKATR